LDDETGMTENLDPTDRKIVDRLRHKFLAQARQVLAGVAADISRPDGMLPFDHLEKISREIHNVRGMGGTFGFRAFSQIAARFEDYLSACSRRHPPNSDEIVMFLAHMNTSIEHDHRLETPDLPEILASLPTRPPI